MPLFSTAAMLSAACSEGHTFKLVNGWLTAGNTDAAMGKYVSKLRNEYADYAIEEVLVLYIPEDQ